MTAERAAGVLRRAREGAHLSQNEVARRAGVAQSVISAYESGQREPAMATLSRLVEATGHRLVLTIEPVAGARGGLPDTRLGNRLRRHRKAILAVSGRYGARNLRVFGSVARGEDGPDSDIDLLVDLDPEVGLVALSGLQRELSTLLGRSVDIVPADGLKPGVRAKVEGDAVSL